MCNVCNGTRAREDMTLLRPCFLLHLQHGDGQQAQPTVPTVSLWFVLQRHTVCHTGRANLATDAPVRSAAPRPSVSSDPVQTKPPASCAASGECVSAYGHRAGLSIIHTALPALPALARPHAVWAASTDDHLNNTVARSTTQRVRGQVAHTMPSPLSQTPVLKNSTGSATN